MIAAVLPTVAIRRSEALWSVVLWSVVLRPVAWLDAAHKQDACMRRAHARLLSVVGRGAARAWIVDRLMHRRRWRG